MGFCTQFQHCEDNPFYPDIVQADQNEGWYSTDQSGWLGLAPNDESPSGTGQYEIDGQPYGGVGGNVMGEKASGNALGSYSYNWGPFMRPSAPAAGSYGGAFGGAYHPMGCWAMHDKETGEIC